MKVKSINQTDYKKEKEKKVNFFANFLLNEDKKYFE